MTVVTVARDSPLGDDVRVLLDEHLADMFATSPPESVHALDHSALAAPSVTFWTARDETGLLGCGALKQIDTAHHQRAGEIKSMRTTPAARGRGVAAALLRTILEEATSRGYERVSLETGTQDFFAPAHRLYLRHGFVDCPPFGDYTLDPNSRYLTLQL